MFRSVMQWALTFEIVLAGLAAPGWAQETVEPSKQPQGLQALLNEARENNPNIRAAKARWEAARRRVAQEGWLEDPKFSYTVFGEEIQTRVGPQEEAFGISQKIPVPTKLYYKAKAARKEADAVEQQYLAAESEVLMRVKQAYYQLYWVRKAIEITEQDKALLEHFEQVARAHFTAHAGKQQDVSKAQVEVSRAIDRLLMLRQQSSTLEANLRALLNRPESAAFDSFPDFELPHLGADREALIKQAEDHRQERVAAERRMERDEAKLSLAKWRYVPDVTAGFNYFDIGDGTTSNPNDGTNAWNVMFTIDLPLWQNTLYANLKEAKATAASSEAALENTTDQVAYEVTDAYLRWETGKNLVELYQTAVIPQAEQALDAAEAAYRAGETDFLNLLDGERVWLNAQLTYWRSLSDAAGALAALERAVGTELVAVKQ